MKLFLIFFFVNCPISNYQEKLENIPLQTLESGREVIALTDSLLKTQCQSSEQQDSIFVIFDEFYDRYADEQTYHFYDHYVPSYYRDKYSNKSKRYTDSLKYAGLEFKISQTDEMYVSYSPAIYQKYFTNSNSQSLNKYVSMLLTEEDFGEGYLGDLDVLVNRIKNWETSLLSAKNPDLINKNLRYFKLYSRLFMSGLDNTYIFSYDPEIGGNGEMLPEFQQIVITLANDQSHPLIFNLFNSFHTELKKHDYRYFKGIRSFYSDSAIRKNLQNIQ